MEYDFEGIPVTIIKKPIKHSYLRIIVPNGDLLVTAPLRFPLYRIKALLEEKRAWIHHRREVLLRSENNKGLTFQTGEIHPFMGLSLSLVAHENTGPMRLILEDKTLHFFIKTNASHAEKQKSLTNWYKNELCKILPDLIKKWEPILSVEVKSFTLKLMKSRWGSCNTRTGQICINVKLAEKPPLCLEYVLVHEMIHLIEASHNKRFYAFMDQYFPEWKHCNRLLKSYN